MKKRMFAVLFTVMTWSLAAGAQAKGELTSLSEITGAYLISATTPKSILETEDAFAMKTTYENSGDEAFDHAELESVFAGNDDLYEMNDKMTYQDGYVSTSYYSTDEKDANYYTTFTGGKDVSPMEDNYAEEVCNGSLLKCSEEDLTVTDVKEENGLYVASYEIQEEGDDVSKGTVTIDPKTGLVQELVISYASVKGSGDMVCTNRFDYSDEVAIDRSPKEENAEDTQETATPAQEAGHIASGSEDINGNPVDEEMLKKAKLIMLNYWEPWCGPCVKEMPDLQKLYDNYKDKGLLVLGVYSSFDAQSDAEDIVAGNGITYPILKCNDRLQTLQKDYFPATWFLDGDGNTLTDDAYANTRSYEEWEELVKSYLVEE